MTMRNISSKASYYLISVCFYWMCGCTTQNDFTSTDQFTDPRHITPRIDEQGVITETVTDTALPAEEHTPRHIEKGTAFSPDTEDFTSNAAAWSADSLTDRDVWDEKVEIGDEKKVPSDKLESHSAGLKIAEPVDVVDVTDAHFPKDSGRAENLGSEFSSFKYANENGGLEEEITFEGEPIVDSRDEEIMIPNVEPVEQKQDTTTLVSKEKEAAQELEARHKQDFEEQIEVSQTERKNPEKKPVLTAKLSDGIVREEPIKGVMPTLQKEKKEPTPLPATGSLSGTVTIKSKGKTLSPENVIIVLEPMDASHLVERSPKTHIVEMKGKKYRPRYLHIRVDDTVVFKNGDPFMHNVFSLEGSNKFDLGTYGRDTEPSHTFEYPGLVKVYCNIHPAMACFIMVSRSDYGVITDRKGSIKLDNLPAGEYKLKAWNIRGEYNQAIEIIPGKPTAVAIQIDASKYRKRRHLNKFGKKYPKKSGDEFY